MRYLKRSKLHMALAAAMLIFGMFLFLPTKPEPKNSATSVYLKPGASALEIQKVFSQKGYYRPALFHLIAKSLYWLKNGTTKGGIYEFNGSLSLWHLYSKITNGDVVRFTVREGMNQSEIAQRLQKYYEPSQQLDDILNRKVDYEGTLFPDTYALHAPNVLNLLERMQKHFKIKTAHLNPSKKEMILASIIQLEGTKEYELGLIAGVFTNRLKKKMKLQSNATIQFFTGKNRVMSDMLKIEHAYNTYLHAGLPPGPVGNPGLSAIRAAKNPSKHDYLFFVVNSKDGHIFSRTFEEHRLAVYRYYQLRKSGHTFFGVSK